MGRLKLDGFKQLLVEAILSTASKSGRSDLNDNQLLLATCLGFILGFSMVTESASHHLALAGPSQAIRALVRGGAKHFASFDKLL